VQDPDDLFVHHLPTGIMPCVVEVDPEVAVGVRVVVEVGTAGFFRKELVADEMDGAL